MDNKQRTRNTEVGIPAARNSGRRIGLLANVINLSREVVHHSFPIQFISDFFIFIFMDSEVFVFLFRPQEFCSFNPLKVKVITNPPLRFFYFLFDPQKLVLL